MKVVVVDYGLGNILSVVSAVSKLGFEAVLDVDGSGLSRGSVILLPGVAAFGAGMRCLEASGQAEQLLARRNAGQGIVGLCLGAQLFLNGSTEAPGVRGLGIADGEVVPLDLDGCRRPNQGWMGVKAVNSSNEFFVDDYFYFSHSYRFEPGSRITPLAQAYCGSESFLAVYAQENIVGVQFHPEKSADAGLKFLSSTLLSVGA